VQWQHWAENRLGNEPGHLNGGVPPQVFCHWSLRPRFAFNYAVIRGLSRTPRTLSAALRDDFRDVRGVGFGPLVLRTIGHDF
jgi:hypothetical protein